MTIRKEELIEAYYSNNTIRRVLISYLGKRVKGY
jgi:hypothetical protein